MPGPARTGLCRRLPSVHTGPWHERLGVPLQRRSLVEHARCSVHDLRWAGELHSCVPHSKDRRAVLPVRAGQLDTSNAS